MGGVIINILWRAYIRDLGLGIEIRRYYSNFGEEEEWGDIFVKLEICKKSVGHTCKCTSAKIFRCQICKNSDGQICKNSGGQI